MGPVLGIICRSFLGFSRFDLALSLGSGRRQRPAYVDGERRSDRPCPLPGDHLLCGFLQPAGGGVCQCHCGGPGERGGQVSRPFTFSLFKSMKNKDPPPHPTPTLQTLNLSRTVEDGGPGERACSVNCADILKSISRCMTIRLSKNTRGEKHGECLLLISYE